MNEPTVDEQKWQQRLRYLRQQELESIRLILERLRELVQSGADFEPEGESADSPGDEASG